MTNSPLMSIVSIWIACFEGLTIFDCSQISNGKKMWMCKQFLQYLRPFMILLLKKVFGAMTHGKKYLLRIGLRTPKLMLIFHMKIQYMSKKKISEKITFLKYFDPTFVRDVHYMFYIKLHSSSAWINCVQNIGNQFY